MQDQLVAFREHDDAHVNATVALNSAHIEALRQKSEGLERRFNEVSCQTLVLITEGPTDGRTTRTKRS